MAEHVSRVRLLGRDIADVVLSRACAGCGRFGATVCPECWSRIVDVHVPALEDWPPDVACWAGSPYDGLTRDLIVEHKERGALTVTSALAGLLALACAMAVPTGPIVLVPIPAHAQSVRRRGFDSLGLITEHCVRHLVASGRGATVAPVLHRIRDEGRQVGRARRARQAAVSSSMQANAARLRSPAILVDDVITSGATMKEAIRALTAAGVTPAGAATIAATPRPSGQPGLAALQPAHHRVDPG